MAPPQGGAFDLCNGWWIDFAGSCTEVLPAAKPGAGSSALT